MPLIPEKTLPAPRRSRRSIGGTSIRNLEKENATVNVGATSYTVNRKKSRSKSIGPGTIHELDALKQTSGNRRVSLAASTSTMVPRSILKPTALPNLPTSRKRDSDLLDLGSWGHHSHGNSGSPIDFAVGSRVAVRTEEEQQAAAREREERERRDARRKSLANRRVSFAAEATLHTFHEIEYMQDSTTSTEATRRQSARAAKSEEQTTDDAEVSIPPQVQPRRSSRRLSSEGVSVTESSAEDETLMSVYSDISSGDAVEEEIVEDEDSSSAGDSDVDDGTMMTMDDAEMTGVSVMSAHTAAYDEDSTLAEAMGIASTSARSGGSISDADDGEVIVGAFVPWAKKKVDAAAEARADRPMGADDGGDTDMSMDMTQAVGSIVRAVGGHDEQDQTMEMTRAVGTILTSPLPEENRDGEAGDADANMDMSMEITHAMGGVIYGNAQPVSEPEDDDASGDATMELTTAVGGIHHRSPYGPEETPDGDGDEDMTMEFTTAMGKVMANKRRRSSLQSASQQSAEAGPTFPLRERTTAMEMDMDMTVGLGRILPVSEPEAREEDATMGMDMTAALGATMTNTAPVEPRALSRKSMEAEVDEPCSPTKAVIAVSKKSSPPPRLETPTSPHEGSPRSVSEPSSPLPDLPRPAHSTPRQMQVPPEGTDDAPSESRAWGQATPVSRTPAGEPPARPRQSPASSIDRPRSMSRSPAMVMPPPTESTPALSQGGSRTPTVVLTPRLRTPSGVGVDRPGFGSPKVTSLLERRSSLVDSTEEFVAGKIRASRVVQFQDPREVEAEEDRERQVEQDKEDGRNGSPDDTEPTAVLRDKIASLSPKKKSLRGRKSLHVGSAKGVLGKRPVELDDDDDTDENDGFKRLRNGQSSPVKNARLPQPPAKMTTNARALKLSKQSQLLGPPANTATPAGTSSPVGLASQATTPRSQDRSEDLGSGAVPATVNPEQTEAQDGGISQETPADRIRLQDFLNMTSIRFMDLNTTKRRHTAATRQAKDGSPADGPDDMNMESYVVAGACTIPMLELYQHSCRELKKYISEGRRIVREIENETFEENPPLFQEYMTATPELKLFMDNQFKQVKTHARFLSKSMWYEWRMKLLEGLQEELVKTTGGMEEDDRVLRREEDLFGSVLPAAKERLEVLRRERDDLTACTNELASCDPQELAAARMELVDLDRDVREKAEMVASMRAELGKLDSSIEEKLREKSKCLEGIKEAENAREMHGGWTTSEVGILQARIDAIEQKHGWVVTGATGTVISVAYRREIELVVDISSFQPGKPNSSIDLRYIVANREKSDAPETEFFLQCIRDHIRGLSQSRTSVGELLRVVRAGWDSATAISASIARINLTFSTKVVRVGDSTIEVRFSMLLVPVKSRVDIALILKASGGPDGVHVTVDPTVKVIYGDHFNVAKVGEFLATKLGSHDRQTSPGDWGDVVAELQGRLIARAKKV